MVVVESPLDGCFYGTITHDLEEFFVCLVPLMDDDGVVHYGLECDTALRELFRPYQKVVDLRLRHGEQTGQEIANDLERLLCRVEQDKAGSEISTIPVQFYECVLYGLDGVGWDKVVRISNDMRQIDFEVFDSGGRKHTLFVTLGCDFPRSTPKCFAKLPEPLDIADLVKGSDRPLETCVGLFSKKLEAYQDVWKVLDDIDQNTWVLDPQTPDPSVLYRRISVGQNCSIQVEVSIHSPFAVCECHFMGSERVVAPLRQRFNSKLIEWDKDVYLRENLGRLLGVEFPLKDTSVGVELVECGICYSFHLVTDTEQIPGQNGNKRQCMKKSGQLPDVLCENPKCARAYHPMCLQEWLQSLPSTRHTFDTMFGKCPYCNESIHVKSTR
mmetsp:Transcript_18336/g.29837  ORF Transcript_18336/g.29837 Transcript_18336/m.29837 type:complete len:384 (+) Transcript_18336:66-1217(+)